MAIMTTARAQSTTQAARDPVQPTSRSCVNVNDARKLCDPSTAAPTLSDQAVQDIIVTGSRVITNGNASPTPLTMVSPEQLAATRPSTVFEGLLDLPQFAGSTGVTSTPNAAGPTNANISALSLRGLGPQRTLILYDGHRLPPTQQDGSVDVNLIPQMLLKDVDIVTGGVSAVYGSGGITGAVNFVTDRKFKGIKVEAQSGISRYGDDKSYQVGVAAGTDLFGGRGHIEGSIQRHYDGGLLGNSDRPISASRYTLQGDGTKANPYYLVSGATLSDDTFGGRMFRFNHDPTAGQQFLSGGVLAPFTDGVSQGLPFGIAIGGQGGYYNTQSLKAQLDFNQYQGRFDFDVTDKLHFYIAAVGVTENSFAFDSNNKIQFINLSATDAFLAPAYQNAILASGNQSFTYNRLFEASDIAPTTARDHTGQWWVNTGLEGSFGRFKWDAGITATQVHTKNQQANDFNNGRLYAALDAVVNPANGLTVCNVTLTNPGLYPGCVPLNPFGPGSVSKAAADYVLQDSIFRTRTTMYDGSAQINGTLFDTWAGPVKTALSGEYRRETYELTSNSLGPSVAPLDCTGLRFNCNPGQTQEAGTTVSDRPQVSQKVGEIAVEANVPLLRDKSFARDFSLNLAYRYAHYSDRGSLVAGDPYSTTTFGANTWKVGATWRVVDSFVIRASRSRDFRAPTLIDLFAPSTTQFIPFNDPLTNTGGPPVASVSQGNPNLKPEISNTTTLGFVFQPSRSFSVAIDGYDIRVKHAIVPLFGSDPRIEAACDASGGTSPLCALIVRPLPYTNTTPANRFTEVLLQFPVNIAEQHTYGIDFETNYQVAIADKPLTLRALVSYQPHFDQTIPGLPVEQDAGYAFGNQGAGGPVWRGSIFFSFKPVEHVRIDWLTKYRSGLRFTANSSEYAISRVSPASYSNATVTFEVTPQANFFLSGENIFNRKPSPASSTGQASFPGLGGYYPSDDIVGTYFTAGVRAKF